MNTILLTKEQASAIQNNLGSPIFGCQYKNPVQTIFDFVMHEPLRTRVNSDEIESSDQGQKNLDFYFNLPAENNAQCTYPCLNLRDNINMAEEPTIDDLYEVLMT